MPDTTVRLCARCETEPATRLQCYRESHFNAAWPDTTTHRCDRCADLLVEWASFQSTRFPDVPDAFVITLDTAIPAPAAPKSPEWFVTLGYRDGVEQHEVTYRVEATNQINAYKAASKKLIADQPDCWGIWNIETVRVDAS